MTHATRLLRHASLAVLVATLAGCAAMGRQGEHVHPTGAAAPAGRGGMSGPHQMGMGKDMQAMCDMHRQKMAGKSMAERRAMMEEEMRAMAPEMRQRMEGMMQNCQ